MLLRVVQSPLWRAPRRLTDPRSTLSLSSRARFYNGNQWRVFTTNGSPLKKQTATETPAPRKPVDVVTPAASKQATVDDKKQKTIDTAKSAKGGLLSETTVGNKEQRKADWAIVKEMAKYLWPKVGAIMIRDAAPYTKSCCRMTGRPDCVSELL